MKKQLNQTELIKRFRKIEMSKKDFLKGAKKSHLFRKVSDDAILISELDNKINRDWNSLANQSVTNPIY